MPMCVSHNQDLVDKVFSLAFVIGFIEIVKWSIFEKEYYWRWKVGRLRQYRGLSQFESTQTTSKPDDYEKSVSYQFSVIVEK